MLDFINGNRFDDIAHFHINSDRRWLDPAMLSRNAIVYCKTDFLGEFFNFVRFSGRKYILISHMSDYSIDERIFKMAPPCIVKWYAQNAVYDNDKLIPIPIGIANHEGTCKGIGMDLPWMFDHVDELKANPKDDKILYCNWFVPNNPKARIGVLKKLRDNRMQYFWGRQGKEEDTGEGEVKGAKLSYYEYCDQVSRYKFQICPPGHGVSIHQPFEAMYFGCVPIVIRHRIYNNCEDMPMIQVNDWTEVNYELLEAYNNRTFNMDKIYMSYWEKLIKDEFNKL